jgi:hypothetical protein
VHVGHVRRRICPNLSSRPLAQALFLTKDQLVAIEKVERLLQGMALPALASSPTQYIHQASPAVSECGKAPRSTPKALKRAPYDWCTCDSAGYVAKTGVQPASVLMGAIVRFKNKGRYVLRRVTAIVDTGARMSLILEASCQCPGRGQLPHQSKTGEAHQLSNAAPGAGLSDPPPPSDGL